MSTVDELLSELRERHGVRAWDGLQVVGASRLSSRPFDPGMPLVVLPDDAGDDRALAAEGFVPDPLPGRHARPPDSVAILRALYPPEHPVVGLDGAPDATIATIEPAALASGAHLVPALTGERNAASPHGLPWLVARLRAPDGCPWDREQDHRTLRRFLLEEAYEVYDALQAGGTPALAEELGDLLLQVVLHAQLAAERGVFDLTDVHRSIVAKIVRRHPHVFGDVEVETAGDVVRNWETIKAGERAADAERGGADDASRGVTRAARDPDMPAAFAGLSRSLPALAYAAEMQERAASLGYDWPDLEGVIDKIEEEAVELLGAADADARREEFGDLLFVVANLGRKMGIDPEAALRDASRKFAARFARVERIALERGVELRALDLDGLDDLWRSAKAEEQETAGAPR